MPEEPAGLHLEHRRRGLLQRAGDTLLRTGGAGGVCGVVLVGRVRGYSFKPLRSQWGAQAPSTGREACV